MKRDSFVINENGVGFIRLPGNLEDGEKLTLDLSKSMAGKTLQIRLFDKNSYDVPFEGDVIYDHNDEECTLDYYGSDDYWKPMEGIFDCVEGHPNCSFEKCCSGTCHVVSCDVWQGYREPSPCSGTFLYTARENN